MSHPACARCGKAISTAVTLAPGPEGTGHDLQYGPTGRPYHRFCLQAEVDERTTSHELRIVRKMAANWKREALYLRRRLAVAEHYIPHDSAYLDALKLEGLE